MFWKKFHFQDVILDHVKRNFTCISPNVRIMNEKDMKYRNC